MTAGVRALLSLDPDREVSDVGALLARVHPDDRDRVSRAHSDALTTGDRIDQRFRVLDADGAERWVDEEVLPHSDDAGRRVGLTGIVRDVTVERRRARTLRRARDMAVLGRTAGAVAHDFNNLLTVILGESTLLEEVLEPGENRDSVGAILEAGERAAALTGKVLGYSRQHRDAPRALDVGAVLDGATALLRSTAPGGQHPSRAGAGALAGPGRRLGPGGLAAGPGDPCPGGHGGCRRRAAVRRRQRDGAPADRHRPRPRAGRRLCPSDHPGQRNAGGRP
ncbi:MAG: PAS domain-containing protein [Gammaproteobacteria bacterium]|nr:PAS domain-containing protein [Gammaproteobacteria bacterium]